MTHCAIEPFHCFRKQPWSEGHRQRRNILCPLFFKRRADNNFSKPYLNLQNRSLPNQSRNVNLKTRSWIKCWHHTAFQGQKKKNTFPYNLLCWVYRSTDTGIKNKPQHKKKKRCTRSLPAESEFKNWAVPGEAVFVRLRCHSRALKILTPPAGKGKSAPKCQIYRGNVYKDIFML